MGGGVGYGPGLGSSSGLWLRYRPGRSPSEDPLKSYCAPERHNSMQTHSPPPQRRRPVAGDPGPSTPATKTCRWGPRALHPSDEDLSLGTPDPGAKARVGVLRLSSMADGP